MVWWMKSLRDETPPLTNKNPFFWYSKKKYMKALAEIIQAKISNNKEFFGINV